MRIWISCLLILVIMLATLSVIPSINQSTYIPNLAHVPFLTIGFVSAIILLFVQRWLKQSTFQPEQNYDTPQSNHIHRTLTTTPPLVLATQLATILLVVISTGLHTVKVVQHELANEITQPIRVLATVRPIGISDSNYYNSSKDEPLTMGYRQLAVIDSAEPLTLAHFTSSKHITKNNAPNPSNTPNIHNIDNITKNLIGKKVMISVHPNSFGKLSKKTKLPTGFSTKFSGLNQLEPTQATQMMLSIAPIPSAEKDFAHRWLRSRHVNAQANVLAYNQTFIETPKSNWQTTINQWRFNVRKHFLSSRVLNKQSGDWQGLDSNQQQARAVTLSLITGDRALISKDTKDLYQLSGISHLLAISGTHVLFLAIILSAITIKGVNTFYPQLYQHLSRPNLRWLVMVIGAILYALFTGFDVPSARTVYMLIAVGMARLLLTNMSSRQVLMVVGVLMAMYDPYVLWQAGFWLSFVAVMLLISYDISMNKKDSHLYRGFDSLEIDTSLTATLMPFIRLQLWIFITLLPLSLLLFGKVSLWGVVINLFAIGFYGWVIVPLNLLAGLLYLAVPLVGVSLADWLWGLVSWLLEVMHSFLRWLVGTDDVIHSVTNNNAWLYNDVNAGMMLIMGLMFLPMLLPRHTFSRFWSVPPMALLVMLLMNQANPNRNNITNTAQTQVTLLDTQLTGDNRNISSILVRHQQDNWLIVANHGFSYQPYGKKSTNTKSGKKQNFKATNAEQQKQLLNMWQDALGKSSISSLTGIIIQTPSPELLQASQSLKTNMPVGYVWLAGKKHIDKKADNVLPCDTGQAWHSEDGELTITAMTGWQEIKDKGVWSCVIQVNQKTKNNETDDTKAMSFNAQYLTHFSTNNAEKTTKYTPNVNAKNNPLFADTIIINAGSKNDKLWQLWGLLCPVEQKNSESAQNLLMSHSYNDFPNELIKHNSAIRLWVLLDKPTDYNKQKLPSMLMDWRSEVD